MSIDPTSGKVKIRNDLAIPLSEVRFRFFRSGGPGGQHVNKVETAVALSFDLLSSPSLSEAQKGTLAQNLGRRIGPDGVIRMTERGERSQSRNKEKLIQRLVELIRDGLKVRRRRRKSAPSRASKEARLQSKKIRGARKAARRPPRHDIGE